MKFIALLLLLTMAPGLWRILRGPSRGDRLLTVQLFGSTGVALVLVFAHLQENPRLLDVALVLATLGVVLPAALIHHLRRSSGG